MRAALSPTGSWVSLPETPTEDRSYFRPDQLAAAARYYKADGYVVLRGVLPASCCDAVRAGFEREVRFTPTPILRQKNMRYELNEFDPDGYLANPIFNIQDLETRRFTAFKRAALDLLAHARVTSAVDALLPRDRGAIGVKLVQSMFFEGPAGTWPHQDTYCQDSAAGIGGATAG
jgi:hypothetical protein